MSRRKQAKPRAFLKIGETAEDIDDAVVERDENDAQGASEDDGEGEGEGRGRVCEQHEDMLLNCHIDPKEELLDDNSEFCCLGDENQDDDDRDDDDDGSDKDNVGYGNDDERESDVEGHQRSLQSNSIRSNNNNNNNRRRKGRGIIDINTPIIIKSKEDNNEHYDNDSKSNNNNNNSNNKTCNNIVSNKKNKSNGSSVDKRGNNNSNNANNNHNKTNNNNFGNTYEHSMSGARISRVHSTGGKEGTEISSSSQRPLPKPNEILPTKSLKGKKEGIQNPSTSQIKYLLTGNDDTEVDNVDVNRNDEQEREKEGVSTNAEETLDYPAAAGVGVGADVSEADVECDDDDDHDVLDDEGDEEDDDYEEDYDLDLHSLDSFYSDIYSTHTSSSYSPSVSDGTMTPNSLHMQQQQQQHPHHQHLQAHQLQHHQRHHHHPSHLLAHQQQTLLTPDDETLERRNVSRRQRADANTINAKSVSDVISTNGDDDDDDGGATTNNFVGENINDINTNDTESVHKKSNDVILNGVNTSDPMEATPYHQHQQQQQQHHQKHQHQHPQQQHQQHQQQQQQQLQQHRARLGRLPRGSVTLMESGALKLPTKQLRKIEKDAAKFAANKLTGDSGIKSGGASGGGTTQTDGSYQCQFCDKSFPRLGYLKKHEQSHAEHLPFKCDYCARLFKHKRSRDRHTKLHTGDRRYRCPHCEAAFSRSDHLKIHMKTHDNQKPFQCTICNRGYNTAAALTSHMQNHKKQAAILAAGGNPQALNYSPRSTGSASSNGSLHKRRYAMTNAASVAASDSSPNRLDYPKRLRTHLNLHCTYCTKCDFNSLEQLNTHVQAMHEKELVTSATPTRRPGTIAEPLSLFQLSCEYCTMKFPSIPAMFQHMRTTHVDRLTSPNSYFEHFNRLAATGTFSPRLSNKSALKDSADAATSEKHNIKVESQTLSPKNIVSQDEQPKQEEPTDLSQNKRRSKTPVTPPQREDHNSPQTPEKPDMFFCNQCNAGLPDFESFRNHLKAHLTQGTNLGCHHCGLALRDSTEYERHVISHFLISNSEFNCSDNDCKASYGKPEELHKHLLENHVVTLYKCSLCSEFFETKVAIQVHFACAHSSETKILRCSACMEVFRTEQDFDAHVRTRHEATRNGPPTSSASSAQNNSTSLQCMFCRTICSSDLEMHFHLAAHARQFRCPSCPETFHVEFLLDRHMQSHHSGNETNPLLAPANKNNYKEHSAVNNHQLSPMNSIYVNALFGKSALMPLAAQSASSTILDYNAAFAAHFNKGLFPAANANTSKFYSPLQVDTGGMKHPALMYGLGQRYFDTNRSLIDMYAQHQHDKQTFPNTNNFFLNPKPLTQTSQHHQQQQHQQHQQSQQQHQHQQQQQPQPHQHHHPHKDPITSTPRKTPNDSAGTAGFSCGICERNDFRTETEVHSHRKIVHNMKTGVSLRCAYCSGNFKSRNELEHHMKTCHNSTGKHKCLICDEVFPSPAILAEHKLQHSKVGQSGKCSHCAKPLQDITAFKDHLPEHNAEAQMPVQCICCRQSLHSDFEIALHAKFHTKSSNEPEASCALCLQTIPNAPSETKICDKRCRKHNLNNKFNKRENYTERTTEDPMRHHLEHRCNLCKIVLPQLQKLREHLVEHTFAGCEDRGYICYICSAVFTAPPGLLNHMTEHGLNARPYDCNQCNEKFYFRAELDHHLIDHQRVVHEVPCNLKGREERIFQAAEERTRTNEPNEENKPNEEQISDNQQTTTTMTAQVKKEILEERGSGSGVVGEEDDEYIEVEKVAGSELAGTTITTTNTNRAEAADNGNGKRDEVEEKMNYANERK